MGKRFIDDFSVLLLDMGDTFMFGCDRFGEHVDYFQTYRELGGNRLDAASVSSIINATMADMMLEYNDPAYQDRFGVLRRYLRRAPATEGLPPSELDMLEEVFARHEVGIVPESHARSLHELSGTRPLGLVSNVWSQPRVFETELARAGVRTLFKTAVWSSDHGCIKPSPRLFRIALAQFDVSPERVLFVGDDAFRDIEGAKAAGLKTAWIRPNGRPASIESPADIVIESLTDLLVVETGNRTP